MASPHTKKSILPLNFHMFFLLANNDEVASILLLEKTPQPIKLSRPNLKPYPKPGIFSVIHK
jgi:hypothetical protein